MEKLPKATYRARIIALQVGFTAIINSLSKENPVISENIKYYLINAGEASVSKDSAEALYELAALITELKEIS